jgi:hypothetical protein
MKDVPSGRVKIRFDSDMHLLLVTLVSTPPRVRNTKGFSTSPDQASIHKVAVPRTHPSAVAIWMWSTRATRSMSDRISRRSNFKLTHLPLVRRT